MEPTGSFRAKASARLERGIGHVPSPQRKDALHRFQIPRKLHALIAVADVLGMSCKSRRIVRCRTMPIQLGQIATVLPQMESPVMTQQ